MVESNKTEVGKAEMAEMLLKATDFLSSIRIKCDDYCDCVCMLEWKSRYYNWKWDKTFGDRGYELIGSVYGYAPCNCIVPVWGKSYFTYKGYRIAEIEEDFDYDGRNEAYMKIDVKEIYDDDVKRIICAARPELSACKN